MAISAEVQHGIARINGIPPIGSVADEYSWSIAAVALTAGSGLNPSSVGWTDTFKTDEIASADGSVIETLIASQQRRELALEVIPSSSSATPTRAEALAFVTHLLTNMKPFSVFLLSGFHTSLTWVNSISAASGSWNYMGGGEIMLKRDTYCIVNVKLAQFLTRADGTVFAALPIAA
jgi:hypothetical protein